MIELVHHEQRAVVAERGATLHEYEWDGVPVIEPSARGYEGAILAPWPNRVVDGRWTWRGVVHQLDTTEPRRGHALHGLVHDLVWSVTDAASNRVELDVDLPPRPGWPFPMHLTASYELGASGLTSSITARNVGREPCPYGVATHPYMARRGAAVDDIVVRFEAATYLATDDRLGPVEKRPTAGTPFDFGEGNPIGSRRVDNAFTDLATRQATVTTPDGFTTRLWGDESVRWWQLFVDDVIALEPMTCAPDALNSGDGIVVLEPGEAHTMTWGLAFGRQPSTRSR